MRTENTLLPPSTAAIDNPLKVIVEVGATSDNFVVPSNKAMLRRLLEFVTLNEIEVNVESQKNEVILFSVLSLYDNQ